MEQDFYKKHLIEKGISVIVPDSESRKLINHAIYEELCLGIISPQSKSNFLKIITNLSQQGAKGVILGCTEIGLLIKQEDTTVPLFDTTLIHAISGALYAI